MADLIYGTNIGCAAARDTAGASPGQCRGGEEFAVPHRYWYPRPELVRLFVCGWHARSEPAAEPLTIEDRAVIAGRRAARAAEMARVTRGPYAGRATTG